MARFRIKGPDGKTYTVTAPDGAKPDDVLAYVKKQIEAKASEPPKVEAEKPGQLESAARGAYQGLTLNFGDELAGLVGAPFRSEHSWGDAYRAGRDEMRAANKAAHDANPRSFMAGEFGGSLPMALLPFGAAGKGATLGAKVWNGMKTGGAIGAAAGLGASNADLTQGEVGQAALDTGTGGLMGAGIGGALPPLFSLGGALASRVTTPMRALMKPQQVAAEHIADRFAKDAGGVWPNSPRQIANSVSQNIPAIGPESMLADAGGTNVQKLTRAFLNRPNAYREQFMKDLDARQGNQWQKIQGLLSGHLADPRTFFATTKGLVQQRSADAAPAYKQAFSQEFEPSDRLMKMFENDDKGQIARPTVRKISEYLASHMADRRGLDSDMTQDVINSPLGFLHNFKMVLDKSINKAIDTKNKTGQSADGLDVGNLLELKRDLMQGIKESQGPAVQTYLDANSRYAGQSALMRALKTGHDDANLISAEEMADKLKTLSPSEADMYRLGVARRWNKDNMTGPAMNDRVKPQWTTPDRQAKLDVLLQGPQRQMFQDAIDTLAGQVKTRQAAQGNSTTASQLIENEAAGKAADLARDATKNAMSGNFGALLQTLGDGASYFGGTNPKVAEEGLKLLSGYPGQGALQLHPAIKSAIEDYARSAARMEALTGGATRGATNLAVPLAIGGPLTGGSGPRYDDFGNLRQ